MTFLPPNPDFGYEPNTAPVGRDFMPSASGLHVRIVTNQSQLGDAVPWALRRRGLTSRLVCAHLDESGTDDAAEADSPLDQAAEAR